MTSERYGDAFDQVKSLGIAGSTTASVAQDLTTAENARLFALLNLSFADGVMAFYDAKYTYNFWRPVTAIRAADTDGNPETDVDPNWLPEVGNTTPDPSYPEAHAVITAAGAEVLTSFFHEDHFELSVTSEVLGGRGSLVHQFLGCRGSSNAEPHLCRSAFPL